MRRILMLAAIVALCGFTPGEDDVAGWTFVRSLPVGAAERGVSLARAPEPVRQGETAVRFTVEPGDCSRGKHGWDDCAEDRERAELKQRDYQRQGETWWYGFSLYLPEDFRNIWPAKVAFAQFHQEGAKPALMFQNDRDGLWLDIHDARGTARMIELIPDADLRGRWHDVVLNIAWSMTANGFVRIWVDGNQRAHYRGPTMTAEKVYFKFGLYRSHLSRAAEAPAQTVYFDAVRRGTSRAAVESERPAD
jgi:hypothetical protein